MTPTLRQLLLAYDAQRPRTQQVEIGMSQLGACRRQTGYMLAGIPGDEGFEENGVQAVLGTAIHEVAAKGARIMVPGAHAENLRVKFGGLTGHPDFYHEGVLVDYKSVGYTMQLEDRRRHGPKQRELWQAHTYGAGLILAGYPVHTVRLNWIARDSGEEFIHEESFDPDVVWDAMAWLEQVRTSEPAMLERDYRPDSAFCKSCKYFERCWDAPRGTDDRHVLFVEDPDAGQWALRLWDATEDRKRAERRIRDAKGALDHLRSVSRPGQKEYISGLGLDDDDLIEIRVTKGRTTPDMEQITTDYQRAGATPPMVTGEPVIHIALVKRRADD